MIELLMAIYTSNQFKEFFQSADRYLEDSFKFILYRQSLQEQNKIDWS